MIYGIDLGTTHSLIALFEENGPTLAPNVHGELLTPSVIGLADDGTMLVGQAAKDRLSTHPKKTVASFKRFMGTGHQILLDKMALRPEEASAFVLRSLKADAEAHFKDVVTDVVISVPAYFNEHQRKATINAGKLAGLNVRRVINEPTAAALAYGLGDFAEGKFLVFDLGGGTFDVSILDKYEGVMEVRATTGDTHLGGNDFTELLEGLVLGRHSLTFDALAPQELGALTHVCERLKIALGSSGEANYSIVVGGKPHEGSISRQEFEQAAETLLRRLRRPLERAIADARVSVSDLTAIILVGGATRMPMVRSLVARLFGRLPLGSINPDTAIALGSAIQGGLIARDAALEDVVMTDVSPYTLGVAVVDPSDVGRSMMDPLIQRNSMVPISRAKIFATVRDNQSHVDLKIYQGENLRPHENIFVGELRVSVPPNKAGAEGIDTRFTYDVNGALEVEAKVISTGVVGRALFNNELGLSEDELNRRFAALSAIKLHPRDQLPNQMLIARAERLYAEHLGEAREFIRIRLLQFVTDLENSRTNGEAERQAFTGVLASLEGHGFPA